MQQVVTSARLNVVISGLSLLELIMVSHSICGEKHGRLPYSTEGWVGIFWVGTYTFEWTVSSALAQALSVVLKY